mmetsp:Transcript_14712/g.26621  ORF Transcript_14712/g.26621 Transcript_14712/m.26621 type:complete len:301 (-) Transcript_14712:30-932(-)
MSHRQQRSWDLYEATHGSELDLGGGTEENTAEDDYDYGVGSNLNSGAPSTMRRPMGSLYAATRPGAQQVNRPAPRQHPSERQLCTNASGSSRLVYESHQQGTSARNIYSNFQLPQQHSPPNSQQQQQHQQYVRQGSSARPTSHQQQSPVAMAAGYRGTYDNDGGIGVGLMIPNDETNSSGHVEEEYPPQQQVQPLNLPSFKALKLPMPQHKPLEPPKPHPDTKRNRRYLNVPRVPDIAQGMLGGSSLKKENHVVMCENCHASCQSLRKSILFKCPKCAHVGPATPVKMKHAPTTTTTLNI